METIERLSALLPEAAAKRVSEQREALTEVRLRAGRPVNLAWPGGDALVGDPVDAGGLRLIAAALMDHSVYAREAELAQGFFTMGDGCRVGVCGRCVSDGERDRLTDIGSLCVRVARAVPGCADALVQALRDPRGLRSTLILSSPGMGKTTLLRDAARQLSESGCCVAIADERHELAACQNGVPTLDVGPRTDVLDGGLRARSIRQMIRAMAPDIVVVDEIGGERDAEALSDASRCGVTVLASAHADSFDSAIARPWLRHILECGAFRLVVLLGKRPGTIIGTHALEPGGGACFCA